jgi:glutathione-regulated potassium-efflux system ancillary protein KefC/glutathione-regulated potassium-efflux system protein KefB
MSTGEILARTFVYLLAGVLAVPIAKRLGLGSVLGYIIAGAVIGPGVLSLTGDVEAVAHVAEFGIVILLFLIGMEVRPALLWQMKGLIFGLGAAQMLAVAVLVTPIAMVLGLAFPVAVTLSLILAMSSTALVMATLDEKGQRSGIIGRACFGVLLFQDLSIIPLFLVVPLLASNMTTSAASGHAANWLDVAAALAAVGLVVLVARFAVRPLFRFIASTHSREVFTAAALMLVVGVAALMTLVGLSPALGAFLAGVVLSETEFRQEIESDIDPFRGLLLGLFFITVGAGLDLNLLRNEPFAVVAIAVGLMIAKTVAMYVASRAFRFRPLEAISLAVMLAQGGEFIFVFIGVAKQFALLPEHLARLLPAAVAISMLLSPLLILALERVVRGRVAPDSQVAPDTQFDDQVDVIVAGFGRFGQIAGRLLQANGQRISIMDTSLTQIEILRNFGQRVNFGDATRVDLLRSAGAETAKALIVAIDDREQISNLVETARSSFPHLVILARAWDRRHAYELLRRGADHVESETYESSLSLGREALVRLGFRAHRAHRSAALFRMHDRALFGQNLPSSTDETGFIQASKAAATTLGQLLAADSENERSRRGQDEDWGTRGLYAELTRSDPTRSG